MRSVDLPGPLSASLEVLFTAEGYREFPVAHSFLQESIVPVVSWDGQDWRPIATAFAIAENGLFATAAHNIIDFVETYGAEMGAGSAGLFVVWESARTAGCCAQDGIQGTVGGPLPVAALDISRESDLAVLQVSLPKLSEPVRTPGLPLTITPPVVGTTVAALGYKHLALTGQSLPGDVGALDYERELVLTSGRVEALHLHGRDRSFLPFPCFEIGGALFNRGLSGSPVFDESGRVVGVVSTGFDLDDSRPISYSALLRPLVSLQVAIGQSHQVSIGDLIVADWIDMDGLHTLSE